MSATPRVINQIPFNYEAHRGLIAWATKRLMSHGMIQQHGITFAELHQELDVLALECWRRFDPAKAKFSTFFWRSATFSVGAIVKRLVGDFSGQTVSLNQVVGHGDASGDDLTVMDVTPDSSVVDPEARYLMHEQALGQLRSNPLFARLLELAANSPRELQQELAALRAQRDWAEQLGLPAEKSQAPSALTPHLIRYALGFNWRHRKLASIDGDMT